MPDEIRFAPEKHELAFVVTLDCPLGHVAHCRSAVVLGAALT